MILTALIEDMRFFKKNLRLISLEILTFKAQNCKYAEKSVRHLSIYFLGYSLSTNFGDPRDT